MNVRNPQHGVDPTAQIPINRERNQYTPTRVREYANMELNQMNNNQNTRPKKIEKAAAPEVLQDNLNNTMNSIKSPAPKYPKAKINSSANVSIRKSSVQPVHEYGTRQNIKV